MRPVFATEAVVVHRREPIGVDDFNQPRYAWITETVDGVLVEPGSTADLTGSIRPDGVEVVWTVHFPKSYTESLRGCLLSVRGREPAPVIGDPQPYTPENTPGLWNRAVKVGAVDG